MEPTPPRPDRSHWPTRKFASHAEADAADDAYYAAMTIAQRVAMVEQLRQQFYAFRPDLPSRSQLPRHAWPAAKRRR